MLVDGARVHGIELVRVLVEVRFIAIGIRAARRGFAEKAGPRGVVAFPVVVGAARGGATRLGGGAGGAYAGLFLGDNFEVEGFGTERFGRWGTGEGGRSRQRVQFAWWRN